MISYRGVLARRVGANGVWARPSQISRIPLARRQDRVNPTKTLSLLYYTLTQHQYTRDVVYSLLLPSLMYSTRTMHPVDILNLKILPSPV